MAVATQITDEVGQQIFKKVGLFFSFFQKRGGVDVNKKLQTKSTKRNRGRKRKPLSNTKLSLSVCFQDQTYGSHKSLRQVKAMPYSGVYWGGSRHIDPWIATIIRSSNVRNCQWDARLPFKEVLAPHQGEEAEVIGRNRTATSSWTTG